jgi:hypothetical protein
MQYLIGAFTGQLGFLFVTNYAESLNKHLFYPLFKKSRLKDTDVVSNILFLFIFFNMALFSLSSARRTFFEVSNNSFFDFQNCHHCLHPISHAFSNKLLLEAVNFNVGFGILLGIYAWPHRFYDFQGIFYDRNWGHVAIRMVLLVTVASPFVLVFQPEVGSTSWRICTGVVVSLVVGFLCSNGFLRMSDAVTGGEISRPRMTLKNESFLKVVPNASGLWPFDVEGR